LCFRDYGLPYGLYGSLGKESKRFTQKLKKGFWFSAYVYIHLAVTSFGATLDMGGWLGLAQQGLSPCKKYQTSLGVLTFPAFPTLTNLNALPNRVSVVRHAT